MMDFKGKVMVITGAGSGFGREFARLGAKQGAKLVLADVQQDALDQVKSELTEQGAEVLAQRTNVAQAQEIASLAAATMQRFGAVHVLFNNAGVGSGGLIWENSIADWEWVLGVNLWGVIHGVRSFVPLMLEQARADPEYRGHIVNTSSVAGLLSPPNMGVYNVSKHAVVTFSETLYQDLKLACPQVHCSLLCPAFVPTGIAQSHRNRPTELGNQGPATASQMAAQKTIVKAVESGRITAVEVAELTFAAIQEERFYILTHPAIIQSVTTRMEDVVQQRNPSDTFSPRPPKQQPSS